VFVGFVGCVGSADVVDDLVVVVFFYLNRLDVNVASIHYITRFTSRLDPEQTRNDNLNPNPNHNLDPTLQKAALHQLILPLRKQMSNGPGNVKIVEVFPPSVQSTSDSSPMVSLGRVGVPMLGLS
jgi:hypothetical protein